MLESVNSRDRRGPLGATVGAVFLLAAACPAQNPDGLIQSDQWIALGPFSLPPDFDCDAGDPALLKDYLAPSTIERLVPEEGDEIDYDTQVAATISYNGPKSAGGNPMWRSFDDGVDGNFLPDDDLDMDQDAINVGSPSDYVTTFVATYFEYSGTEIVDAVLCAGSDDSIQVWIDAALVLNNNDCRGRSMCQDNVPVTIAPGVHRIILAVFERNGSFGGSLGFKDLDGNPITDADPDWTFLGPNRGGLVLPEAKFSVDVSSGHEPLTVQFDGSASASAGGSIKSYAWQFGDGQTASGAKVTHEYQKASYYTARLIVTNEVKGVDSSEQVISVILAPESIPPWSSADVGSPALAGGERRQGDCIAVFGGGSAIAETSDQFHFTYVEKSGDVDLTVQIDEALWSPGAIAGIMLRESLAPDSRFAFANAQFFAGVGGVQYGLLTRKSTGARALASRGEAVPFPAKGFLRLERKGNTFNTYTSTDGKAWAALYSTIFAAMSDKLLAGFAVASGDTPELRQSARVTFCSIGFGELGVTFHRGDTDDNGKLELTDAVRILTYLFSGTGEIPCLDAADADDNGQVQLTDAVRILNYLFLGTGVLEPPAPPPEACGLDPTPQDGGVDLGCASYTHCGAAN